MAFLSCFIGMMAALIVWVSLYNYLLDSDDPTLNALAPHFEAMSVAGILLFLVLSAAIALFAWRTLARNKDEH